MFSGCPSVLESDWTEALFPTGLRLTYKATDYIAGKHSTPRTTVAGSIPCDEACCLFKLTSLSERRDSLYSKLFRQSVSQSHILHCLLPAQRGDGLTGRFRSRNEYPTVRARTNRFKNSFIPLIRYS